MKQLTTTLNGHTIHMVEVPEDAKGLKIINLGQCFRYFSESENYGFPHDVFLPDGRWMLIGLCAETKDEVLATLTYCPRSKEEIVTFLKSHHFNPSTTVILIKE